MKIFFFCLIFLQYIEIIFSVIPSWKFDSSTQALLNQTDDFVHEYIINSGTIWAHKNSVNQNDQFEFKRRIVKKQGVIKQENKLYINGILFADTPYDEIESIYRNNNNNAYFVCPKGKFHVQIHHFDNGNNHYPLKKGDEVNEESNWDLKCFYQYYEEYLFISYLNNEAKFYQYHFNSNYFYTSDNYLKGLYAYSWTIGENNPEKRMFAIVNHDDNEFRFEYLNINVYSQGENKQYDIISKMSAKTITNLKSKKQAYFTKDETNWIFYYFINYNDENDFETGFNKNNINQLVSNTGYDIGSKKNATSPFIFYENITVNEIKFISYTRFVYYNISVKNTNNQNTDKFYYGIIDITLNKIIFNTDEQLLEFKPYNNNSMLAITSENAYKICPIAKDQSGWLECKDECSSGELIVDSTGRNLCENKCKDGSFNIWPDNICIDKCDENIYQIDYNAKECKLCKDINTNKKFKITNFKEAGCLENKPGNSYFKNEKLGLVACYEGFNYLENNNCVEKCSDNYYHEEEKHICKKCNDECRTCEYSSYHCTSCKNEEYLDFNTCKKCNNNKCKTCFKEDDSIKCLSCDQDSKFIYLFNSSCLEECPQNYTPSEDNTTCIFNNPDKKEEEKEEPEGPEDPEEPENDKSNKINKTNNFALSLFIGLTSSLIIIILFFFYRGVCCRRKKSFDNLIDNINTELEPKEL